MRVLVAEDSKVQRLQLELCLADWGYDVESVADGESAWKVLKGPEPPRLIVLDWVMPDPDGRELCHRIRASRRLRGAYVMLLTAKGETADALETGADGFLRKPVDPTELLAGLRLGERVLALQDRLDAALAEVKRLRGLVPEKG